MKGKIFNAQEVQAILNGSKVMFREVVKPQPNANIAYRSQHKKLQMFFVLKINSEVFKRLNAPTKQDKRFFAKRVGLKAELGGKLTQKMMNIKFGIQEDTSKNPIFITLQMACHLFAVKIRGIQKNLTAILLYQIKIVIFGEKDRLFICHNGLHA